MNLLTVFVSSQHTRPTKLIFQNPHIYWQDPRHTSKILKEEGTSWHYSPILESTRYLSIIGKFTVTRLEERNFLQTFPEYEKRLQKQKALRNTDTLFDCKTGLIIHGINRNNRF